MKSNILMIAILLAAGLITKNAFAHDEASVLHCNENTVLNFRAALLLKVSELVTWPKEKENSKTIICIKNGDKMKEPLNRFSRAEKNKKFSVLEIKENTDISKCHVLFVSDENENYLTSIADKIEKLPILTVSPNKGFTERGGMIEFSNYVTNEYTQNATCTVGFTVNKKFLAESGLQVHERIYNAAKEVIE